MMHALSLDQLSVMGVSPAELIEIAAAAGFEAVSPFVVTGGNLGPMTPLRAGTPQTRAMTRRMRETGVRINNADGFSLHAGTRLAEFEAGVELMAAMGARGIVAIQFDPDAARGFDHFCKLGEAARDHGLAIALEFMPFSEVKTLRDALGYVRRAGIAGAGIMIDLLHLMYSGATPRDVAALDPALILGAQICDGPSNPSAEQFRYNAVHERMLPGEGELPVAQFLAALPADLVVGIEVPLKSCADRGEPYLARARRLIDAARAVMAAGAA